MVNLTLFQSATNIYQAIPPIFLAFLRELINTWDGIEGRELILDILTYTPLADFRGMRLYDKVLTLRLTRYRARNQYFSNS